MLCQYDLSLATGLFATCLSLYLSTNTIYNQQQIALIGGGKSVAEAAFISHSNGQAENIR